MGAAASLSPAPKLSLLDLPAEMLVEISRHLEDAPDLFAFAGACPATLWALGGTPEVARRFGLAGPLAALHRCPRPARGAAIRLALARLKRGDRVPRRSQRALLSHALRARDRRAARLLIAGLGDDCLCFGDLQVVLSVLCAAHQAGDVAALVRVSFDTRAAGGFGIGLVGAMRAAVKPHHMTGTYRASECSPAACSPRTLELLIRLAKAVAEGEGTGGNGLMRQDAEEAMAVLQSGELMRLAPYESPPEDPQGTDAVAVWNLLLDEAVPPTDYNAAYRVISYPWWRAVWTRHPSIQSRALAALPVPEPGPALASFISEAASHHPDRRRRGMPHDGNVLARDPRIPPGALFISELMDSARRPERTDFHARRLRLLQDPETFQYDLFQLFDKTAGPEAERHGLLPALCRLQFGGRPVVLCPELVGALLGRPEASPRRLNELLAWAVTSGHPPAVDTLLGAGADPLAGLETAASLSATVGDFQQLDYCHFDAIRALLDASAGELEALPEFAARLFDSLRRLTHVAAAIIVHHEPPTSIHAWKTQKAVRHLYEAVDRLATPSAPSASS